MRNREAEQLSPKPHSLRQPPPLQPKPPGTTVSPPKQESSWNPREESKQMVVMSSSTKACPPVAVREVLDAKGYRTETHRHQVRACLNRLTEKGVLIQTKGTGHSSSYTLNKDNTAKKPASWGNLQRKKPSSSRNHLRETIFGSFHLSKTEIICPQIYSGKGPVS
eukprot:gi/632973318/ref/XP_007903095.1/ PREDICTED: histone H1t-like [Callorhinchus milii]